MRSQSKADKIKGIFPKYGKDQLDFAIVEDIAQPDAFDDAVLSDPPFEAVIHTASPFHFNAKDIQKVSNRSRLKSRFNIVQDLLDPAIIGTTGILRAIKKSAPSVKKVVITSSFAAVRDVSKGNWPEHTYTELDWNLMTFEEALLHPANGYTGKSTAILRFLAYRYSSGGVVAARNSNSTF